MQMIEDRRNLHRIPELGMDLPKTMAYLSASLAPLGCRVFAPMESALCAFFDYGQPTAIAFRADCDGLPVAEKNCTDYISTHPGQMHACGHDGHMAILLELARRLSQKKSLPHNVLLVFQPGEETPGGARFLCETDIFETYAVEAIFGLHLWPGKQAGVMFSREQELMSRSSEINVDIYGKSAHISKASEGLDALSAAVEFYRRAMDMEASLPKHIYRLLKFGYCHSGTVRNALSAHTRLEGSLRAFQDDVFDTLRQGLDTIAAQVEAETGCAVKVSGTDGYPAVINPPELYRKVAAIADVQSLDEPNMGSEDFAFYQKKLPGIFFFLGIGDTPPLHADHFDFDETILLKGADFFEHLAEHFQ